MENIMCHIVGMNKLIKNEFINTLNEKYPFIDIMNVEIFLILFLRSLKKSTK